MPISHPFVPVDMSSTVSVRPATTDDIIAIQEVAGAAWQATYDDVFDDELIAAMVAEGYDDDVLKHMIDLDGVGLFIATNGDEIVGYASCGMTDPVGIGDLDIYVHPDYWGEGVGQELLARGREHLDDLGTTTIRDEVLAANDVGNAFYEKHFDRVGQRTVEFGGEDQTVNVYEASV